MIQKTIDFSVFEPKKYYSQNECHKLIDSVLLTKTKKIVPIISRECFVNKNNLIPLIQSPGVLGAYSSKTARNYILELLDSRGFDPSLAMFKDDNRKEFWQMIYVPFLNKKRYFSYDLVVFSDRNSFESKDLNNIDLVFEYNGPWHYRSEDILGVENLPATPYKSNKFTRAQQIMLDNIKLTHIIQFQPKEVLVYWYKHRITENIFLSKNLNR